MRIRIRFFVRMEIQMQISLSHKYKPQYTLLVLAAMSISLLVPSILLLREMLLPLAVAILATIFVLEDGRPRIFSIAVPLVSIAVDLVSTGMFAYLAIETTIMALIIAIFFLRGSKAECSFWLTLTASLFWILFMAILAYDKTDVLSLDAFLDYYVGLYEEAEKMIVDLFKSVMEVAGTNLEGFDIAEIPALLSAVISLIPSMIIVFGFLVGGVSLKLFSIALRIICDEESTARISAWRFFLPRTLYVAFWVAAALNLVSGLFGGGGTFAIVVANVYNVLLYVFAYVGLGVVIGFFTALFKKRWLAILVTVAAILSFGALAIELIAYFGASFVFFRRRDRGEKNL